MMAMIQFVARVLAPVLAAAMLVSAAQVAAQAPDGPSKPRPAVEDSIAQRMQACVVCHGEQGRATNSGYFPRIAGKPQAYLYNQLRNFREGRRSNRTMNHLMQHMSDAYLREIAAYFAELDLPYPPVQAHGLSPSEVALAQSLVRRGAPERQIPACTTCHGSNMAGRLPAMPGLLSLPSDYLISQLGAWRTDIRRAQAPDCMAQVARRMTAEEISVIARWLSAQTLPAGTRPEPASAEPLPIRCGGVEQ